ncbi:hypothetical protein AB837_00409 [bacterium AB1]|nr:hypothetical protein AB837_00409 [bacterium AB1]
MYGIKQYTASYKKSLFKIKELCDSLGENDKAPESSLSLIYKALVKGSYAYPVDGLELIKHLRSCHLKYADKKVLNLLDKEFVEDNTGRYIRSLEDRELQLFDSLKHLNNDFRLAKEQQNILKNKCEDIKKDLEKKHQQEILELEKKHQQEILELKKKKTPTGDDDVDSLKGQIKTLKNKLFYCYIFLLFVLIAIGGAVVYYLTNRMKNDNYKIIK